MLPLAGGSTPATDTTAPIRHRFPDFFAELSGTPVVSDPTHDGFAATALRTAGYRFTAERVRADNLVMQHNN